MGDSSHYICRRVHPPKSAHSVSINKKRRFIAPCGRYIAPQAVDAAEWVARKACLSYVDAVLLPILALNGLHLILEAEFQLLQPHFFQLFVFAEIPFLGECFETLRVLGVLMSQPTELVVTGQELVFRSQHPADLQPDMC